MTTGVVHVRFSPEEKELVKRYASFKGVTVSTLIRESVLELIENQIDVALFLEAVQEDDGTRVDWSDVKNQAK